MIRCSLVFVAGTISVLAFAPFNLWWLSIVSLSFLLALLHDNNYHQGFALGYLYGLGRFGFGTSWIFHSVFDYGQAPFVVAVVVTLVLILILSLFPAIICWVYTKQLVMTQRLSVRLGLFVSAWVLGEWLRSWIFTGFPWLLYGHTLVDSPFSGIIPFFGTFGGSALVVFIAGALIEIVYAQRRQAIIWALVVIITGTGAYFLNLVRWTEEVHSDPIPVALVQANIPFEMKWDKSRRNEIYQIYADLSRRHWDSEIIVWPETAIPTFYRIARQDFLPRFEPEVIANDAEILSGVFTYEVGSERVFNSLVTFGGEVQIYNKQHLVPFGEYMPFRWIFDFLRNFIIIPMSDLSAGKGSSILVMRDIPVGVSICYEAAFGEEILRALPQAQILANVSNDAWFGDSLAPHQHLQIARSRALETGRYLLRATNTGISAIIDPQGRLSAQSAQFIDSVVTGEVKAMKGRTPFIIWGNWGIIIIMFLLLLLALRNSRALN